MPRQTVVPPQAAESVRTPVGGLHPAKGADAAAPLPANSLPYLLLISGVIRSAVSNAGLFTRRDTAYASIFTDG